MKGIRPAKRQPEAATRNGNRNGKAPGTGRTQRYLAPAIYNSAKITWLDLEINLIEPLEPQDFPCLIGCCRFDAQFSGDTDDLGYLLAAVLCHLALFEE